MAEDFIRQLTHDNAQFEEQWSAICSTMHRLPNYFEENQADAETSKVKVLDALVDFILAEPIAQQKPSSTKSIFVELLMKACADDPQPPLAELVRLVRRIIDQENIFNQWYWNSIEQFHFKFRFCEALRSAQSFDLIQLYLESYLKHSFFDDQASREVIAHWKQYFSRHLFSPLSCDSNKLNDEETMQALRTTLQQVFR